MKKKGKLARLAEWFRETVLWTHVIAIVLEWFGWQSLVISFALSAAGTVGGVIQGVPSSVSLMAGFCVFVAAVYLFQIPSVVRATRQFRSAGHSEDRPNPEVWKHLPTLRLFEAACLLADIQPNIRSVTTGDANGWYRALKQAVDSKAMPHVPTQHDSKHTFMSIDGREPYYVAYEETVIEKAELQKFAVSKQVKRAFL